MDITIQHNKQEQTFFADIPQGEAELAYSLPEKGIIDFQHTYVSENARSQGVAEQLVKTGLAYAKDEGLQVIATCAFVASYVKRHAAEYQALLAKQ